MKSEQGFTRADLMAVIAILSIFAMLGAARIGAAGDDVASTGCLSNQRQLLRALHLYTADNGDYLPFLSDDSQSLNWLRHTAHTIPDATNAAKLINPNFSLLARYLNGNASVFKCPADPSTVTTASGPSRASVLSP
jgi:competence protein ComGC